MVCIGLRSRINRVLIYKLLYRTDSLTHLEKHRRRFQICEIKYPRRAAECTRNQVGNANIRAQFQQYEIEELLECKS